MTPDIEGKAGLQVCQEEQLRRTLMHGVKDCHNKHGGATNHMASCSRLACPPSHSLLLLSVELSIQSSDKRTWTSPPPHDSKKLEAEFRQRWNIPQALGWQIRWSHVFYSRARKVMNITGIQPLLQRTRGTTLMGGPLWHW